MSSKVDARAVEAVHGRVDGVPMWTTFPGIWKPGEEMGLHAFGYWSALISVILLPTTCMIIWLCCCRRRSRSRAAVASAPPSLSTPSSSNTLEVFTDDDAANQLRKFHFAARDRKIRLTYVLVQMGWSLFIFGVFPMIFYVIFGAVHGTGFQPLDNCWPGIDLAAAMYILTLAPVGVNIFLLAFGPSDTNFVRVLCWLGESIASGLSIALVLSCILLAATPVNLFAKIFMLSILGSLTCALLWAVVMIRPTLSCKGSKTEWAARKKLRRVWLFVRILLVLGIALLVCTSLLILALALMHTSHVMDKKDE